MRNYANLSVETAGSLAVTVVVVVVVVFVARQSFHKPYVPALQLVVKSLKGASNRGAACRPWTDVRDVLVPPQVVLL